MEDITINTIEWHAPEYDHKEHTADWFWSIGIIALVSIVLIIYLTHNYVFAIFVFVSGASLILFTIRPPHEIDFSIKTEGITMGKDSYKWKSITGFDIKTEGAHGKLLLMTSKKFMPLYTVPFPLELSSQIREAITKVVPRVDLEESRSMVFMEKLGF
ncbi:MAG: hypothetical protein KGI58_00430 [Patescibacteria group bacterium]|nr:hypothetical protein [Patescibacteria group bacterium]